MSQQTQSSYLPSTNLLDKRLLHDCFHSKQIFTVRNEMKLYTYRYKTSSLNKHESRFLERCPGIYKKSYSIATRHQQPEKGAGVCVGLCCIWKIQFASLYLFRVPVRCWSNSSISSHDDTTCVDYSHYSVFILPGHTKQCCTLTASSLRPWPGGSLVSGIFKPKPLSWGFSSHHQMLVTTLLNSHFSLASWHAHSNCCMWVRIQQAIIPVNTTHPVELQPWSQPNLSWVTCWLAKPGLAIGTHNNVCSNYKKLTSSHNDHTWIEHGSNISSWGAFSGSCGTSGTGRLSYVQLRENWSIYS